MSETLTFEAFPKISRLKRSCVITEKVDGTNGQIVIGENGKFLVGSRTREIWPEGTPGKPKGCDNFGFAQWAYEHKDLLVGILGPGRHYGEWAGKGIQRGYGMESRKFFLFNTSRWSNHGEVLSATWGLSVVPLLWTGEFTTGVVDATMQALAALGSKVNPVEPGHNAEGIIVFLPAGGHLFKVTFDDIGKWAKQAQ